MLTVAGQQQKHGGQGGTVWCETGLCKAIPTCAAGGGFTRSVFSGESFWDLFLTPDCSYGR